MNYLDKVEEFHETFDHPILDIPTIPVDRIELRINLLREELQELEDACKEGNIVDAADAFADLQYVLSGAIIEFGFKDRFNTIFDEVHRSNMSKACKTRGDAAATMEFYNAAGQEAEFYNKGNVFIVRRKDDHKTLKSLNYSKANIAPLCK